METEPLRKQLREAERIVKEKMELLADKKAMLERVEEKIRKLEEDYKRNIDKKEYLGNYYSLLFFFRKGNGKL